MGKPASAGHVAPPVPPRALRRGCPQGGAGASVCPGRGAEAGQSRGTSAQCRRLTAHSSRPPAPAGGGKARLDFKLEKKSQLLRARSPAPRGGTQLPSLAWLVPTAGETEARGGPGAVAEQSVARPALSWLLCRAPRYCFICGPYRPGASQAAACALIYLFATPAAIDFRRGGPAARRRRISLQHLAGSRPPLIDSRAGRLMCRIRSPAGARAGARQGPSCSLAKVSAIPEPLGAPRSLRAGGSTVLPGAGVTGSPWGPGRATDVAPWLEISCLVAAQGYAGVEALMPMALRGAHVATSGRQLPTPGASPGAQSILQCPEHPLAPGASRGAQSIPLPGTGCQTPGTRPAPGRARGSGLIPAAPAGPREAARALRRVIDGGTNLAPSGEPRRGVLVLGQRRSPCRSWRPRPAVTPRRPAQVQNISLAEGETLTVESAGGLEPAVLANESFLLRGQVIRSPANLVTLHFQSPQPAHPGSYRFHFQAYLLSCPFPARPADGDVSVTSLHPGGDARFRCAAGYQLQGARVLSCRNATRPFWSAREPRCVAACGGAIRNATVGRIVSPGFPSNYSNNLTCHWLLEAPAGHRLHLHFEKVSLAEDDDRFGPGWHCTGQGWGTWGHLEAPPVYDSYEVEYLPIEGLLSTGRHFFVELTTDSSGASTGMALRYEAFEHGHCYEPFVKYGNFTASNARYPVGTTVEFSCDPGYTLEQGSTIIECAYGKGQDCIWGLHVEEDKRVMLDVRVLRMGKGDVLTFYDGDDLTARILGQYTGVRGHFKLYASTADVTIQFQSDPGTGVFGYQQGFVIHFYEVPRNDTCPELPEIPNGWKTTSHPELIHGTVVTYHCYPGFELTGTDVLMCHWDLTWSGDLPACERVTSCRDPGDVEHSRRVVSSARFPVGATVQFVCDKGYVLTGTGLLTCHDRAAGGPKWSDRVPKCIPEAYEPCHNPGAPANGLQSPERRLYPAGTALRFSCAAGHVLLGEGSLRCLPGHPSRWSGSPPICKAGERPVAKAVPAGKPLEGTNVAVAVFLPVLVVALLGGGVFLCFSR
uniref:Seizure related 6 homolog n=1 Tax=Apteryx owenii TaxID=8824 RepID=A0A8B9PKQ6_APTOW